MKQHAEPLVEPVDTDRRGEVSTSSTSSTGSTSSTSEGVSTGSTTRLGRRLWLTIALSIPTFVFSTGLHDIIGLTSPTFAGSQYIPVAFGVAIAISGGLVFVRGAIAELRTRRPSTMTLRCLALVAVFGSSLAVTLGASGTDLWWQFAALVILMLIGHWIELAVTRDASPTRTELEGIVFLVALVAALVTLVAWLLFTRSEPGFVLERVVAVLVIASPPALGLATALVARVSMAHGASRGILILDRLAFEAARSVDIVLFDKTGTLTIGEQQVVAVVPDDPEVLRLAAGVEARSKHPAGRAIVAAAKQRTLRVPRGKTFSSLAGRGVTATVEQQVLTVASAQAMTERSLNMSVDLVFATREYAAAGATVVYLMSGDEVLGLLALADTVRSEASDAVSMVRKRDVRVAMVTSDTREVAHWVGARTGIDEVYAAVPSRRKAPVVGQLQSDGSVVAMVGDGIEDAAALARADVGIAIGSGGDVAVATPRQVPRVIALSRATWRRKVQNLVWATGYNALAIPLAAGVAIGAGLLPTPALAVVLATASTVVVALNAQLLRTTRLG